MSASNEEIRPLFLSDYSFNPFLLEADDPELDLCQFMDTDDSFELPGHQMLCLEEEPTNSFIQTFPINGEIINSDMMSGQLEFFSEPENFKTMIDNSSAGAQFCNKMLPNWSDQIMKFQGAAAVGTCVDDDLDCEGTVHGDEEEKLELVQLFLAAGQMIGNDEYDQASLLVSKCKQLSSQLGSPTQRVVYYISDALQQKIRRNTLGIVDNASKPVSDFAFNINGELDKNEFCSLVAYYTRILPHIKVLQFTSVQATIDAVGSARKIHIIDLGMRTGSQWTVLMEFLAHRAAAGSSSRLQILKMTAVGMNGQELRKSGRRLYELAKSLDIPFAYKIVEIKSLEDIKKGLFSVRSGEALAVYAPIVLRSLLYDPVILVNILCAIRKLRPRIMVTVEIEARHNSPSFVKRLSEVLYQYSAFFDLLDSIFPDRNDVKRVKHEELIDGNQIRNMIVYEGDERTVRHVTIDVWRSFFTQAGFKEMIFSFQALYQAKLLLTEYATGHYYTLEPVEHALTVGWKGTPLFALSGWSGNK
ncbi:hypothetical protein SUGI_0375870 [Cryptomeria japonica]|uniref:DELLA protein RGL1-like n=1 Tax=Cryptomeria japonica TaxID=3369 RepID=UPI002408C5C5|nr:DELLA protein RGL1-like [Cryptomeria japonica]GLJ20639.1 hypothetical protein SUGI_0375870 [Cryptomeria japonica]